MSYYGNFNLIIISPNESTNFQIKGLLVNSKSNLFILYNTIYTIIKRECN